MRTARSSGRPGGGLHQAPLLGAGTPLGAAPPDQVPPPWEHTPRRRHPPATLNMAPLTDQAHTPPGEAPLEEVPPGVEPPVDRHTPVNILPCPKLRLRAVKTPKQTTRWQGQIILNCKQKYRIHSFAWPFGFRVMSDLDFMTRVGFFTSSLPHNDSQIHLWCYSHESTSWRAGGHLLVILSNS